jgi:2-polyprenyl-3-methyl-5-hydroxy-6-metoxy-1,4-benzoquinol methylase
MTTDFRSVVQAWREADPKHIHPTREHESEQAYWESGKPQAEFVRNLMHEMGVENPTVMDFGCGDGRIAIPMALLGIKVHACDASLEMIERLEHNAKVERVQGIVTFLSDGTNDWTEDALGSFDAVNARAVFIHHAHDDVAVMVHNLARCIRPGGFLVADWPVGDHHERVDWIDVTTWDSGYRQEVATAAGLTLVTEGEPRVRPSVWVKQ